MHLVIDDESKGTVELLRVLPPHYGVQQAHAEVLATPLARTLLYKADARGGDTQLLNDFLTPLVHQTLKVDQHQRAVAQLGSSVECAHGLAATSRCHRYERAVLRIASQQVTHERGLRLRVADTRVVRIGPLGYHNAAPSHGPVLHLQVLVLVQAELARYANVASA